MLGKIIAYLICLAKHQKFWKFSMLVALDNATSEIFKISDVLIEQGYGFCLAKHQKFWKLSMLVKY